MLPHEPGNGLAFIQRAVDEHGQLTAKHARIKLPRLLHHLGWIKDQRFESSDGRLESFCCLVLEEDASMAVDYSVQGTSGAKRDHRTSCRLSFHGGNPKILLTWEYEGATALNEFHYFGVRHTPEEFDVGSSASG